MKCLTGINCPKRMNITALNDTLAVYLNQHVVETSDFMYYVSYRYSSPPKVNSCEFASPGGLRADQCVLLFSKLA